jgi:hypothetical protein
VVVLGVVVAVLAVVVGATAASGWRSDRAENAVADQGDRADRSVIPAAEPEPAPDLAAPAPGMLTEVPAAPDAARDATLADKAGTLVARGDDVLVVAVELAGPTTVVVDGVSREVSTVYRVTITAGPYVMRDMPAVVSVDGVPIGVGAESVDLSSLVVWTFDDRVATNGPTIAVTYGLPGQAAIDWSTTLEVAQ